jgi:hypothetical protein
VENMMKVVLEVMWSKGNPQVFLLEMKVLWKKSLLKFIFYNKEWVKK